MLEDMMHTLHISTMVIFISRIRELDISCNLQLTTQWRKICFFSVLSVPPIGFYKTVSVLWSFLFKEVEFFSIRLHRM